MSAPPGPPSPRGGPKREDGDVVLAPKLKVKPQTKKPTLYRVLLHNDDYTPRWFVVSILEEIFHHDEQEATRRMLHAHTTGLVVAGVYPHDVAETKVEKVKARAEELGFPLLSTLEPE